MMSKAVWDRANYLEDGYLGYVTSKVFESYDGFVCPLIFVAPGEVPKECGIPSLVSKL